ncbi:MAG: FtsX-like permease family protein [Acidobacteriota bacterium]
MIVLRLGWRNLWRNSRRSLITISAVACGFAFLIVLIGLMVGVANQMLHNGTELLMGDVQLHHQDYLPERNLYDTLGRDSAGDLDEWRTRIGRLPELEQTSARVYAFGLLSTGNRSAGAQLMGVEPDSEVRLTAFLDGLEGNLTDPATSHPLILGKLLAQELEAVVGTEVAVVTQSADGSLGNDLFHVSGILHTGLRYLDRTLAVFTISDLQELLVLESGQIHEIAMSIQDPMGADRFAFNLNASSSLPPDGLAQSWGDLAPQLRDYIGLAQSMYGFMIVIIGLFVAVGVLNTMMMAVFERSREIGLLNALGMRPWPIVGSILLESVFLGLLGLGAGLGVGAWAMSYLTSQGLDLTRWMGELSMLGTRMDPVLKAVWGWDYVLWSAMGLLISTLLAAFFPAVRAARLDPVKALAAPVEG